MGGREGKEKGRGKKGREKGKGRTPTAFLTNRTLGDCSEGGECPTFSEYTAFVRATAHRPKAYNVR